MKKKTTADSVKKSSLKIDAKKAKATHAQYLKEIEIAPKGYLLNKIKLPKLEPVSESPTMHREASMYEGSLLYLKYWNYWVRAGERADDRADRFYPDFENSNFRIFAMLADIGVSTAPATTEKVVWDRVAKVWNWLSRKVSYDGEAYGTISTQPDGGWPSIDDYAAYFETHGNLVWAACFSKAHLFVSILGRIGIPRWHVTLAESHHTEGGAPPTATHVFAALYIADKWLYLDPTWVYAVPELPDYFSRESVGLFERVDYIRPYATIPIPLSGFTRVPLLNKTIVTTARFLANRNTKEIHDLEHAVDGCKLEDINEENRLTLATLEEVQRLMDERNFDGCRWCMAKYHSD